MSHFNQGHENRFQSANIASHFRAHSLSVQEASGTGAACMDRIDNRDKWGKFLWWAKRQVDTTETGPRQSEKTLGFRMFAALEKAKKVVDFIGKQISKC